MNGTRTHYRNGIFCVALMGELIAPSGRAQDSRLENITVEDAKPVLRFIDALEVIWIAALAGSVSDVSVRPIRQ